MIIRSKKNNKYYYDNRIGQIFYIPQGKTYEDIKDKYGVINEQIIKHTVVTTQDLEDHLYGEGNGFKQLILELTSSCNLRCKYCIYSEFYPTTRSHGNTFMSFETAKKAIDYYFINFEKVYKRNPLKKPILSLYGGEPLLHLDLLKKIVMYIKKNYSQYEVAYNITTNGLLFNKEAQDFLTQHEFAILISLDGYQENHDRNRVDIKGRGTFDRVMDNINHYRTNYPNTKSTLMISTCFDYKTDLTKVSDFFDANELAVCNMAQVQASNSTYYEQFSDADALIMQNSYNLIKDKFFQGIEEGNLDKNSFVFRYFNSVFGDLAYHPMALENQPKIKPYTGTCIPGEKIYVTVDGEYKICEKINSVHKIGDVNTGLNLNQICKILNDYNQSLFKKCSKCSISRICKLCFKDFENNNSHVCKEYKKTIKGIMEDYVNLLELDPTLFEEITTNYYNIISEAGELA